MFFSTRAARLFFQILFPLLFLAGCREKSADGALLFSTNLEFRSYVHSVVVANGNTDTKFYFPLLQVYDVNGRLVYVGHDAQTNSGMMAQLPDNMADLRPIPNTASLFDVMSHMPDFTEKKNDLIRRRRTTVLSVFLEDCHACSLQEKALDERQQHLLNHGVNVLIIKVTKPV